MKEVDFWFAIGSTYTYLSVMRVDEVAAREGVSVNWHAFDIRHVLNAHDNTPFADNPVKSAYMWHDIARQSDALGLSPKLPAPYPTPDSPFANRVAWLGLREGWGKDYVRATYRRWFEEGLFAGQEPNLSDSIAEAGADPAAVIKQARSREVIDGLSAATEEAMDLGIFGAPTFAVGRELFWGNDRLEEAIGWAKRA